jgi:dolichyl-phosphate beta-glucosyltransferase
MARVILVVPCYNEEQRLRTETFRAFSVPGHQVAFCFVNDGSRDGTLRVLEALRQQRPDAVRVVDLAKNQGKAEAVRRGFMASLGEGADFIGFWDADLATPLGELPRFLEILEGEPARQMVFGARVKLLGRQIERKVSRHYLGRVFATAVSLTLGLAVYDTQCGAKVFRTGPRLQEAFAAPFVSRWIFDVEIIARFLKIWRTGGGPSPSEAIYELPLLAWNDVAGSKLKSTDFLKAIGDLWRIRRQYVA